MSLTLIPKPEVIGDPECPILYRWTLLPPLAGKKVHSARHGGWIPDWMPKLLLHHFLPYADDRDFHDHPRSFITIVLKGGYDDIGPYPYPHYLYDSVSGQVVRDRMRPGTVRYRRAEHIHRTRAHANGCWTLVLMGPMTREWGFWPKGSWMHYEEYREEFGHGMRCE